jgi:phage RecT family recombinase
MATATNLAERVDDLQAWFHQREGRLSRVAQDSLAPERAVQLLIEAGATNPRVLQCRRLTLWRCVQVSLELGLPIGAAGQLWVLPFKNGKMSSQSGSEVIDAVPVIGYKGWVTLLGRSGLTIKTRLHYEGESWRWVEGSEQTLHHQPDDSIRLAVIEQLGDAASPAAIEQMMNELVRHAYSIATTPTGLTTFEVLSRGEIDTAQAMSPGKNAADSPWRDPLSWPRMVRKTVLSRHAKELPIGGNAQAERAVVIDDHLSAGGTINDLPGFDDPEGEGANGAE